MPSLPAWCTLLNSDNRDAVLKMQEADYALHSVPRKIGTPLTHRAQIGPHSPLTCSVRCSDFSANISEFHGYF